MIHPLHILGYRQDATIFRQKSGALRKAFKNRIEFGLYNSFKTYINQMKK